MKETRIDSADRVFTIDALNERSRAILRQIVESYLQTGEPVGSRNLARVLPMNLSPASIRNVMSDLEHTGLIASPHTSAGRLKSAISATTSADQSNPRSPAISPGPLIRF